MKLMGCKSFINQIEELKLGQAPDATTRLHLDGCQSCRSFYEDRLKLREMLSDLEPIAAPGDFGFRVKARLANEAGKRISPFSIAGFGFGLPTVALIIVAALIGVGFYTRLTAESNVPAPVAQVGSQTVTTPVAIATDNAPGAQGANSTPTGANEPANATTADTETAANHQPPLQPRKSKRTVTNVRRDDFLAKSNSVTKFPLESAEPLRVSVDYTTGGSKTISLPSISFGSQQVVAQGASMVKTSARTVW